MQAKDEFYPSHCLLFISVSQGGSQKTCVMETWRKNYIHPITELAKGLYCQSQWKWLMMNLKGLSNYFKYLFHSWNIQNRKQTDD